MQRPSTTIVAVVAARAECDVCDLPALYEAIDPDALDALMATQRTGQVSFFYAGYEVAVFASGEVHIEALEESGERDRATA